MAEEQVDALEVLNELKAVIGNLHQELAIKTIQLRKLQSKLDSHDCRLDSPDL